jgi:C1A family cysteine protease
MEFDCCIIKSPVDARDFPMERYVSSSSPPKALDLRNLLFPVRNQGSTSMCAGFSAASMKEWQETQTGPDKNEKAISKYLSPAFVYFHRENSPGRGMYLRDVMRILRNRGICYDHSYPTKMDLPPTPEIYEEAIQFKIKTYASITNISTLKKSLYENGPCIMALPVYNYTSEFWKEHPGDSFLGGHAVTIFGYTETHLLLRNSWGLTFGILGYTYFPLTDFHLIWEIWSSVDEKTPRGDHYNNCCHCCLL